MECSSRRLDLRRLGERLLQRLRGEVHHCNMCAKALPYRAIAVADGARRHLGHRLGKAWVPSHLVRGAWKPVCRSMRPLQRDRHMIGQRRRIHDKVEDRGPRRPAQKKRSGQGHPAPIYASKLRRAPDTVTNAVLHSCCTRV